MSTPAVRRRRPARSTDLASTSHPIQADHPYVVPYFTPSGATALDGRYFDRPVVASIHRRHRSRRRTTLGRGCPKSQLPQSQRSRHRTTRC